MLVRGYSETMGQTEKSYYYLKGALDYREKILRIAYDHGEVSLDTLRETFPDDPEYPNQA